MKTKKVGKVGITRGLNIAYYRCPHCQRVAAPKDLVSGEGLEDFAFPRAGVYVCGGCGKQSVASRDKEGHFKVEAVEANGAEDEAGEGEEEWGA